MIIKSSILTLLLKKILFPIVQYHFKSETKHFSIKNINKISMALKYSAKVLLKRLLGDCIITGILLFISVRFFKIFGGPRKRGFFCDDESLKYPYREDTVGAKALLRLTLCVPLTVITLGELLLFFVESKGRTNIQNHGYVKALIKFLQIVATFLAGFALHTCFVHLAKITVVRLRPNFFHVCKPYLLRDGSTCDNPANHGIYIEEYSCQHTNDVSLGNNVHISFPSGHASYIFYGMIYIILYLQRFTKILYENGINIGLLRLVLQMLCALLAWFVALSRVSDYKHHWSDVLVGIVLGTSVAIAVWLYVRQQLMTMESVNSYCPEGVKSSNISDTTSTTTFTANTANTILVP